MLSKAIIKKKYNLTKRQKTSKKIGRPTKKTEYITKKLVAIFKLGVNVQTALNYAKISSPLFYTWYNRDNEFKSRIDSAREFGIIASSQVVTTAIVKDKDLETAKWYLERRSPEFSNAKNTVNIAEQKILVIPSELLTKHNIQSTDNTDNTA